VNRRTGLATTVATVAALAISACGSSTPTTSSTTNAAAALTTSTTSTTAGLGSTTTTSAKSKAKKAAASKSKKHDSSHKQATTTTTTSTTAPTTTSSTTTSSTTTTTTSHQTTTTTATLASLPSGYVTKSNSGMTVQFEGQDHSPKISHKWEYFVEAKSPQGQPLAGKVLTEFVFSGTVEGKEVPPYHNLSGGKLANKVTFPPDSFNVPLDVQVVVTTKAGQLTLDWPVKSVK
jgi:hypothetical protein